MNEWSRLFQLRDRIHDRYRDIWDVPLIKKRRPLLRRILRNGMRVLDVGAGMRGMRTEIERLGFTVDYRSMDVDRTNEHDFYSLDDVEGSYDLIVLFEVIEHLPLDEGIALLRRLRMLAAPGGRLIVSTPNIFNPSRYFRDATHRTFYAYDELCGLMSLAGFEISEVYRSFNDAFHRYVLKVYIFPFLFRFLSIDFASSIFVVGENRGDAVR